MTGRFTLALVALVFTIHEALADDRPDAAKTPGAILGTVPDDQAASCLLTKPEPVFRSTTRLQPISSAPPVTANVSEMSHKPRRMRCIRAMD